MHGITAYGAYIPRLRLQRRAIVEANGDITITAGDDAAIVSIAGAGNARRRRGARFSTGYVLGPGE